MGVQSTVTDMVNWARAISAAYHPGDAPPTEKGGKQNHQLLTCIDAIMNPWCLLPVNAGGKPAYGLGWFLHDGQYIFDDMFDENRQE